MRLNNENVKSGKLTGSKPTGKLDIKIPLASSAERRNEEQVWWNSIPRLKDFLTCVSRSRQWFLRFASMNSIISHQPIWAAPHSLTHLSLFFILTTEFMRNAWDEADALNETNKSSINSHSSKISTWRTHSSSGLPEVWSDSHRTLVKPL